MGTRSRKEKAPVPDSRATCDLARERRRVEALFSIESEAYVSGARAVVGIDEVGRGCLAGPIYAGAVVLDPADPILGLDDSKALLPEVRADLSPRIHRRARALGIGAATPAEIDAIGIDEAGRLAMRRALAALGAAGLEPDLVLVDAIFVPGLTAPQRAYIKGDARVACIAAASVVAKEARDRFLDDMDRQLPYYGFASHKGYATPEHLAALRRHGPSPAHRLSFDGVVTRPRRKVAFRPSAA